MMSDKDMGRCFGKMENLTKDNGTIMNNMVLEDYLVIIDS